MSIAVRLGPREPKPPRTAYRWDSDTGILSAQVKPAPSGGTGACVEIEGADGSWIILDLQNECLCGIEIAVWPEVHTRGTLAPPAVVGDETVRLPQDAELDAVASLEVETPMAAESDSQQRIFHFRFGGPRQCRAVRAARDLLLDVDANSHVAGLWLLNVPPSPTQP